MKLKKTLICLLVVVLVAALMLPLAACNKKSEPAQNEPQEPAGPHTHSFDFSDVKYNDEDDYFAMVECSGSDCTKSARRDSDRPFDEVFVYTYNTADGITKEQIDARIAALEDVLNPESANYVGAYSNEWANEEVQDPETGLWHHTDAKNEQFAANKTFEETYYDPFYDDLEYVTEQYQIAYVFYCVNDGDEAWEAKHTEISDLRTELISEYYSLFKKVYDTKYREFFFSKEDGWTEEDIHKALVMSESYGNDEYKELNKQATDIETAFRNLDSDVVAAASGKNKLVVPNMYAEYVNYKNQLAQMAGYANYVEYAYENEYDRDYSPEDVAHLRAYAKQYLAPVFQDIVDAYRETADFQSVGLEQQYFLALTDKSIFDSKIASDAVGEYLKGMHFEGTQGTVDYYKNASDLFKDGNVYSGDYSGAFNYWIGAQEKSVLYFGPDSYSGAFTFIHEFGHYNNSFYNQGTGMSYDLDETHSQGNEMMFLAYLSTVLSEYPNAYAAIKNDQLVNMFAITLLAMAVDEFEQAVYTNTYTGEMFEDGITPDEYDKLFYAVMDEYGIKQTLNRSYWRYVVIESPCYYISYSTSAMASLQLYAFAMEDLAENHNLNATRAKYYKLITFTDDDENAHTDFVGDRVVDIGFAETLKYAGLYSIFEEDCYQFLSDYFSAE
ncbi:MAG: hypothetical protein II867_01545 [Clostridia bacterium]|nr:hypothetical protein [Clostridia bacterium]